MVTVRTGNTVAVRVWVMLAIGTFAQLAGSMFVYGAAMLIPALQRAHGLDLSDAGLVVSMPLAGTVVSFLGWGALVDRFGERLVLTVGSTLTAVGGLAAVAVSGNVVLAAAAMFVGGVGAAGSNSASAALIIAWFAPSQRGLAMAIRHVGLPLGVGLAALTMPQLADSVGIAAALAAPSALAAIAAFGCGVGIVDSSRGHHASALDSSGNPYRRSSPVRATLLRVHAVAVLLSVAQSTLMVFAFVWLNSYHDWSAAAAGGVVTLANVLGIAARIGSGIWSDRIASRMRPLRVIACASAITMGLLAIDDAWLGVLAVPIMVVATVIAAADRSLVFTAAMEVAGRQWSGRSLGLQNTFQYLAGAAIPPVFGALISATGYAAAFAAAAACAGLALILIPPDTSEWQ